MANNSQNQKVLVLTCLTGTDSDKVLAQTQLLQPPVPAKGSADYQTFITRFAASPANIIASVGQFIRQQSGWNIQTGANFQAYLNTFENAPFLTGTGGGTGQVSVNVHDIDSLISNIMDTAGVPTAYRQAVSEQLDLANWFAGDFENSPKGLQLIIQNMVAANGQVSLSWLNTSFSITYFPPEKKGILNKKPTDPTYKLTGSAMHATANTQPASWFAANAEQLLSLGFTNVTDWINNNSTPIALTTI